ncbi:E3 ubiquitin-protein ligase TM129-like [Elysia marginata]|uniref:E3 ubiquitin-protein ligase TM129-like n=1 Tax=Elysia marginata TaxID=1093978 RepID=A0AAV4HF22_9GAST|nr:E3 ubiquitin-protein ligase TM129-like [Elysia marginata]
MDTTVLVTIVYCFFAGIFVAPPTEFVSAGITIQNLLSGWLGSEDFNFIYYHIKRTSATVIAHSFIPLGYYLSLGLFAPEQTLFSLDQVEAGWLLFLVISLLLPGLSCICVLYWHRKKWDYHPLARQLSLLGDANSTWRSVASSINVEFRRVDKFTSGTPSRLVAVTDSWIIKTSTYSVNVAHQNDIHLSLSDSEEHALSYQNQMAVQYLNIQVSPVESGLKPFSIRLNSLELGDLKEKLQAPIRNARNIVIHQSLSDRFLQAFTETIQQNSVFIPPPEMELEQCIGCMQKPSNVKLQRVCDAPPDDLPQPTGAAPACVQCFCRPMWCLECMGKWFASRQDQLRPDTWLSGKSPCPTCRATFCLLDVCKILGRD